MLIPIHKKGMAGKPQSESSVVVSGPDIFIPAGNYKDDVNKSVEIVEQAVPSVEIDGNGLITAEASQEEGYVEEGIKSNTKQLTTQAAKTITPTTSEQTAVSAGVYTTGAIKVNPIPSNYITTTDATAAAGDILSGKTAYVDGNKVTGTIATKTASNLTASGATVTVPAGYYANQATKSVATASRASTTISTTADDTNDKLTFTASNDQSTGYVTGSNQTATKTVTLTASGATVTASDGSNSVSKSVATATQATPNVSVSSAGLITASATQSAGYVSAGTKSATKQLTVQAAQTITPGTSNKTISSGRYLTGTQTIKGDANLIAENIKEGVTIFGVLGTAELKPEGFPIFTYTGDYSIIDDGDKNWRIKFLTSGTLTFAELNSSVDIFLVGGGGGAATCRVGYKPHSEAGGGGGYTKTHKNIILQANNPYEVIIGAGGSAGNYWATGAGGNGGASSACGYSAGGGYGGGNQGTSTRGGNGGSGGGGWGGTGGTDGGNGTAGSGSAGSGQGSTTKEFGETTGTLYSTGGSTTFDYVGENNTGNGGSAYGNYGDFDSRPPGNAGGSGIVVIRNTR